jgi:Nucleotidyl transferase AbiEii toxin, Type IV TA system
MDTDRGLFANELVRAVEALCDAFAARSIRHALIGGLAISMRSRPRLTQDVDFLLDVPQVDLPGLLDDLVERGFSLDPAVVIKEYVREHLTAFSFGTVRIDWVKPVLPFYARALADAQLLPWTEGHSVRVATPEGLILTKMVAFRPQDQMDIEALLTANRNTIDIGLIREEWSAFAASEPERTVWLEAAIAMRVVRRE